MFSKNFSKSLGISIALHLTVLATITSMSLFSPPTLINKIQKIVYIKTANLKQIKKQEVKKAVPKTIKKAEVQPKKEGFKKVEKKIKKKVEKKVDKPKKVTPKPSPTPIPTPIPKPIVTPTPLPKITPMPTPVPSASLSQEQINDKVKITVLKQQPYFKNWSDERIKRLELPPGIKDWNETTKITKFFDEQYNWVYTPPALGNDQKASPEPTEIKTFTPEIDAIVWKEYRENTDSINYEIRFYKDKIGFIASFNGEDQPVAITYFPFDGDKIKEDNKAKALKDNLNPVPTEDVEVKIPDKIDENDIKYFFLNYNKDYETERRLLIVDVLEQYKIVLKEEEDEKNKEENK